MKDWLQKPKQLRIKDYKKLKKLNKRQSKKQRDKKQWKLCKRLMQMSLLHKLKLLR